VTGRDAPDRRGQPSPPRLVKQSILKTVPGNDKGKGYKGEISFPKAKENKKEEKQMTVTEQGQGQEQGTLKKPGEMIAQILRSL
jgi:hypothetical protein